MLQKLRDHAGSWFIKLLFVILVLSFAMWGIGDVVRNYATSHPVLSVGSFSVSLEEFMQAIRRMGNQIQTMSKGKIKPEEIKQMDLGAKVVEQYTNLGLLDEEIRNQQLIVPDATLAVRLREIPTFRNTSGQFDPAIFRQALQHFGITEARFVHDLRQSLLQEQLLRPLVDTNYLPQSYIDLLLQGLQQEHVFAIVEIFANKMNAPANTDDKTLKTFFDKTPEPFMVPESRAVSLLIINIENLKKLITIPENQIQDEYERRRDDYVIEEKREITEVTIPSKENLHQAVDQLRQGIKPSVVAKAFKGHVSEMGFLKRADLTPEFSDKAFEGTKAPYVTDPIEDKAGGHIFIITAIHPQSYKPFVDVRKELIEGLLHQAVNERYEEVRTKIEDSLAGGASFAEVAKDLELSALTIESIDRQGNDAHKKSALPGHLTAEERQKVIDIVFSTSEGTDSALTEIGTGTTFVLHVNKVIYAHLPDFANIRAKVVEAWQRDQRFKKAAEVAQEVAKANSPKELAQIAAKFNLKIQTLPPISRSNLEKDKKLQKRFPAELWQTLITAPKNKAVYGATPESVVVGMLTQIKSYDSNKDPELRKRFAETLHKMIAADIEASVLKSLRQTYKVTINQDMLTIASDRSR